MVQDKYVANVVHKKYGISNHVDTLDTLEVLTRVFYINSFILLYAQRALSRAAL